MLECMLLGYEWQVNAIKKTFKQCLMASNYFPQILRLVDEKQTWKQTESKLDQAWNQYFSSACSEGKNTIPLCASHWLMRKINSKCLQSSQGWNRIL